MKLILLRHGVAIDRADWAKKNKDDSLRPLLPKGKLRTKKMCIHLSDWIKDVDVIVHSPYQRAKETALIAKAIIKPKFFRESVELIPEAPPQSFVHWLKIEFPQSSTVIAIGHEPHLSTIATWLLSGQTESFIQFKKSGILCLDVESFSELGPRCAELSFLVQPKLFE